MTIKIITVQIESIEENSKIKYYVQRFLAENFQKIDTAKVEVKDAETD